LRFNLLPRYDILRRGVVFRDAALQFTALGVRQERRVGFGSDTVPNGRGQGNPVLDAQTVDAQFLKSRRHGAVSSGDISTAARYHV